MQVKYFYKNSCLLVRHNAAKGSWKLALDSVISFYLFYLLFEFQMTIINYYHI